MVEMVMVANDCGGEGEGKVEEGQQQQQGQVLALVLATLRKSVVLPCQMADAEDPAGAAWGMEIGWPTDVRHVAHVTFDRLHGFLGLPAEFELEIPGQVPSASASVFGVSPESMQCGYDDKGNSVPKILLLMQERLYTQDGLKAEGIFRITPENSQEEHVREQLNSGIVPDDIDVHCLASLIKIPIIHRRSPCLVGRRACTSEVQHPPPPDLATPNRPHFADPARLVLHSSRHRRYHPAANQPRRRVQTMVTPSRPAAASSSNIKMSSSDNESTSSEDDYSKTLDIAIRHEKVMQKVLVASKVFGSTTATHT